MAGLPARYGSPLGQTAFLTLVSCFCSFSLSPPPPVSVFHVYCHFVSPLSSPLVFTNCFSFFSPFPLFPAFSYRFLFCASCTTQTLLPCPSLPYFSTQRLHLPSQYHCYQTVHCSQLPPVLVFALSFSTHYYVSFCLPALHLVILLWSSAGLQLLPPPLVYATVFYHLLY